jgi:hypothetical protein
MFEFQILCQSLANCGQSGKIESLPNVYCDPRHNLVHFYKCDNKFLQHIVVTAKAVHLFFQAALASLVIWYTGCA